MHPLGIGGKADPVRLVFDAPPGPAINVSLIDIGGRFRLIVNEVDAVKPPKLPKLPVARAVWECRPDFKTACAAWIHAGGAHHTGYSYAVTTEHLEDFAEMAGIEFVLIDETTQLDRIPRPVALERPVLPPRPRSVIRRMQLPFYAGRTRTPPRVRPVLSVSTRTRFGLGPYGPDEDVSIWHQTGAFLEASYIFVRQDVRGRG